MTLYEGRYKVTAQGYHPIKGKGIFVVKDESKLEEAKEFFTRKLTWAYNMNNKEGFDCDVRFTSFKKIEVVIQY